MMDARRLLAVLPHRFPMLLVDRVVELDPGRRAVAWKCVSANEPYFQGHFPGDPVMPGVMLVEAMAQVAAIAALTGHPEQEWRSLVLLALDRVRFRRPVVPGDRLVVCAELLRERRSVWRFAVRAEVEGVRVVEGEILASFSPQEGTAAPDQPAVEPPADPHAP